MNHTIHQDEAANRSTCHQLKLVSYFPALQNVSFRKFLVGQFISLTGTWMQTTALSWLVYMLSNSSFLLGMSVAVSAIPMLILAPFSGTLIAKLSEKRILIYTHLLQIAVSLAVALLLYSDKIEYIHILFFSFVSGSANAVNMPARQSFICKMTGQENLANGVALNSIAFNVARMIGPAVAGILMGYAGIYSIFIVNSLCLIPLTYWVFRIKVDETPAIINDNFIRNLKDTLKYVKNAKILIFTLLISATVGTLAMNYNVLTPVVVKEILKSSDLGYGILLSFMGIGSLLGALTIAVNSRHRFGVKYIIGIPVLTSVLFLVMGLVKAAIVMFILHIIYGFCITTYATISNITIMLNSDDNMRGNVIGIYTLLFNGTNPIGCVIAGMITNQMGVSNNYILFGLLIGTITILGSNFAFGRQSSKKPD